MSKIVPFQTIQFRISTEIKCKYTIWLSKTFLFQAIQFIQTVLMETIKFSISMQLVLFNRYYGPIRCYHSGPEWTWEQWQWRGTPHSPKLQHHWNLTIRLFSVISRTLMGGLLLYIKAVRVWFKNELIFNNILFLLFNNLLFLLCME